MTIERDKLGRYIPGQTGNPAGRPKKDHTFTEILRSVGDLPRTPEGKARKYEIAEILWDLAMKGDKQAIRLVYNRVDGMPHQSVGVKVAQDFTVVDWPEAEVDIDSGEDSLDGEPT